MNNEGINEYIADAIMGRPHGFLVEGKRFYLYPATLGRMFFTAELIKSLGVNEQMLRLNTSVALMQVAREKKGDCVWIITYCTCRTKKEIFDTELTQKRWQFLVNSLDFD